MYFPFSGFLILVLTLATAPGFKLNTGPIAEPIDESSSKLALANNDLAVNVYRQLTEGSDGNVFFSPLSLSTAFGMLYYGARGDTAEELRNALGYNRAGLEEGVVHQAFRKYLTETLPSQDTTAYTLNSANAVLLDKQLDLVPNYKTEVQDLYQASVQDVDFSTQGSQIVQQINGWVREKTNGKIDHLLDKLDSSTLMVLLNAVYFKGAWKTKFHPSNTRHKTFYNNGLESGQTQTDTMHKVDRFPYAQTDDVKVLELPYRGDNVSMLVLLPKERDGLESLEASLTATRLSELRGQLVKKRVQVMIPKFKLEYERELSREFQALGAEEVFTPAADFSGITNSIGNNAVIEVLHKAVIEVNEEGSEAAAVTGIKTVRRKLVKTVYFKAEHPFLFAIIDRRNDLILFLGRVTNL